MKKEELFDLLENVDRRYINEAMFNDLDGDSPAVARPGKAKISPLKIIAPIAACMAVVIGTGAVVSRLNKPGQNDNSDQQQTTQQEIIAPNAFVQVDFKDKDLKAEYASNTVYLDFTADDIERDFLAECISIIKNESESARQDGVSWHVTKLYSLCGSSATYDYFIQPRIDGRGLTDVGIRVFHKTRGYSSIYGETFDLFDHGGFGQGFEELGFDSLTDNNAYYNKYYCRTDTIGSAESTSLREIYVNGNNMEITEKAILEKVVDGDNITYTCYEYWNDEGKTISEEEFIGTWNTYPFIPKFYTEFTTEEVDECREALKESLGVPDSVNVLWRDAEVDIDLDGTKELLLSPQDLIYHRGVYVFARTSSGIKQVGSFDTVDGSCKPEEIRYRNVSADEYFPYYVSLKSVKSKDGLMTLSSWSVHNILVDENGNITTEAFLEEKVNITDEEKHKYERVYFLNGEEVSDEEYNKEWRKYWDYDDHKYYKPTVPTDPDNYAWD